jgi:hypothetical protein
MKLNKKQSSAIESLKFIVSTWEKTNDINSPTLGSDVNEEFDKLYYDDILSEDEIDGITSDIFNLLGKIQRLK